MKRLVFVFFLLFLGLGLIGCGNNKNDSNSKSNNDNKTSVIKLQKITYDDKGMVTSEGKVNYEYDENGNIISIENK